MSIQKISIENGFDGIELKLVFRKPVEDNFLSTKFSQSLGVLNMIWNEERKLSSTGKKVDS